MQLIYNLLNSRRKLTLTVLCVVFNITVLYIARPATNVVIGEELPQQGLHNYAENTNKLARTKPRKGIQKEKFVVKGPVTFVRHLALKVNSLRSVYIRQKENVNISETMEENYGNMNSLETRIQSMVFPTSTNSKLSDAGNDGIGPLMENLVNRLSLQKQDDLNFKYLINPTEICQSDTYLLIAVCSTVQRVDYRKAIRETWGSVVRKNHLGVKLVFVVGEPNEENSHYQNAIPTESHIFNDVLQINHVDHSRNLSFKTLGVFHWIKGHCGNVTFVMKTDDDIFLNTRDLLKEVKDLSASSKVIMGHVIKGAQPLRIEMILGTIHQRYTKKEPIQITYLDLLICSLLLSFHYFWMLPKRIQCFG